MFLTWFTYFLTFDMKLIMKERRKQVVVNAGPCIEAKKSDWPCGGGLVSPLSGL